VALIALVLGAALAAPALVVAADPATTTDQAQTSTTTPDADGTTAAPAAEPVQSGPASPAQPPKGRAGKTASAPQAGVAATGDFPVDMKNFKFDPKSQPIKVGDKVTWRNASGTKHNVTFGNVNHDVADGANFSHTFDQAGTFDYYCKFHGSANGTGMAGTIKVEASGGSNGSGGTPSSGGTSGSGGTTGSTAGTSGSESPLSASSGNSSGSLPSTGADLIVLGLLGGDLLLAGLVLREALAARRT
jgi:plastocyanin